MYIISYSTLKETFIKISMFEHMYSFLGGIGKTNQIT